jgi:uncharacterized protein YraI
MQFFAQLFGTLYRQWNFAHFVFQQKQNRRRSVGATRRFKVGLSVVAYAAPG